MSIAPGWNATAPAIGAGWVAPSHDVEFSLSWAGVALSTTGREWMFDQAILALRAGDAITGLFDSARDATESIEHPSGDGALSGMMRDGSRTIVIRGFARGRTAKAVGEAKALLRRARLGVLVADDRTRMLGVELSARSIGLVWERRSSLYELFTLTLIADDPLLYSTAVVDLMNGANTLVNRGDRDAWPVLEFVGPHAAVSLTHLGGVFTLTALAAGVARTVDLRNGDVWEGGVRVFGAESGPAPVVPAGGASLTVAGLGAGSARIRRFEAWS